MSNLNFLICLVGLPASGKTTFASALKIALKKKFNTLNIKIIDPDKIRQSLTPDKFNHEKEPIVRKTNLKIIQKELEKGNIVISDDLNYYTSMRHDLKEISEKLNVDFYIVHIATPIEICLKWNQIRGNPIPKMVINKVQQRFDEFNKYKWDIPDAVYDLSQISDINQAIEDFLATIHKKRASMKLKVKSVLIRNKPLNLDNQNLDKITRSYVGILLGNSTYLPWKRKIIKLRKNFVRNNKNRALKDSEILKTFKEYIEKKLDVKITENL